MPSEQLPPFLNRYRGVAGENLDRLRSMILQSDHYFASPRSFNDPFDCRPVYQFTSDDNAIRRYIEKLHSKFEPGLSSSELTSEIDAIFSDPNRDPRLPENQQLFAATVGVLFTDNIGVLCLSESATVPLMWSHYAESHQGVCLGFDSSAAPFNISLPVRYSEFRPKADPTTQTRSEMLDNSLFTKSKDWGYEREWRILLQDGFGMRKLPAPALRQVVLGARMKNSTMREVLAWIRSLTHPVVVYRAATSSSTFSLELRQVA